MQQQQQYGFPGEELGFRVDDVWFKQQRVMQGLGM
jgi:hypothetical protein